MKTIILNSSNIDSTNNNVFRYKFPAGSAHFQNNRIGLSRISLYYSWENISSTNNKFSYTWVDGTSVSVTLPAGFYTVDDINSYMQSVMVTNTHYLVNSSGDYVYYLELVTNSTYYAVQLNSYPVPNALPSGWSNPGVWALPASAKTPQFTVPTSNSITSIIGFSSGTYPSATQSTNYSKTSDSTPQVTPTQSLVMTCNLINNKLSIPADLMYSFSPNVTYGSLIIVDPPQPIMNDIRDGSYQDLVIRFYDQDLSPVTIKDKNVVILLQIQ